MSAVEQIIDNLLEVEAMCDMLKRKAYSTRKKLEGVSTPSNQKKSTKKRGNDIVKKYMLSIAKMQIK